MSVGERIKAEREGRKPKLERKELAELSGVPYPTLAGIENGDQASTTKLHAIAHALGVYPQWLETGTGPKYARKTLDDSDWPDVLAFKQAVSLGSGSAPDEYAETHKLKFRADSLRKKHLRAEKLGVVYGKGDSMLPRIRSGDAILFDTSDTVPPKDGHLYVISYKNDLLAKRLVNLGGRWFFESLNPEAESVKAFRKPQPIDEFEQFKIEGRIRWIGSWED